MPPKAKGSTVNKAVEKAKDKIISDKTFGLKNKNKSKTVQKYIKGVANQVKGQKTETDFEKKKKKEEELERLRFENLLVAPTIIQPKVPIGVDPKSVLCEFFKVGKCTKGDRCKYSHNIDQGRKSEKIDIYTDRRNISEEEEKQEKENDTMDKWDQEKLERVVDEKQGAVNENLKTKIVCKYFLEAIESKKYGWFWECPNGALKCIYQHCLPPGYVLKKEAKKDDDDEEPATVEELIEEERTKLVTRTPLTKALFLKWKEEKRSERDKQAEETKKKA